jgi:hypothetical protein
MAESSLATFVGVGSSLLPVESFLSDSEMSGILYLLTLGFAIIIGMDSSWSNGVLFFLGFVPSSGVGGVIRSSIRGERQSPLMYVISAGLLWLSFWLGGHGQIIFTLSGGPHTILGEWWTVIAGTVAGLMIPGTNEIMNRSNRNDVG